MEIGLLIGIPFFTSLILFILDNRASGFAGILACLATAVGLLVSLSVAGESHQIIIPWITAAGFHVNLSVKIDTLSSIMLPLVHGIALLVQCYSLGYLKGDRAISRYFAFLQLFLFSMVGILLAGNLIIIYIFWELVGISSYLLIGFWNQKPRTVWAAQKAFILNRIGDAAFLSGILLLIYVTGTVEFGQLSTAVSQVSDGTLTVIGLLLFGGCIGKSAQFPLSAWLPDAMEGPTPVSALIHAATMVAAGIFLMTRVAFLLTPSAEIVIAAIGLITTLDGAIRACFVWDIKKVLAYSTQSQLGLMVFAVGLGAWEIAFFHLVTHAFFKAGLFLSAGSVIHAITPAEGQSDDSFDPQDMRTMGGLKSKLPLTFACYLICAAALAGLPFFSGFLSKDAIFLEVLTKTEAWGFSAYVALAVAMFSAGLTAFYMTRQLYLIFFGTLRYPVASVHPHESGPVMWVPMMVLAIGSFFFVFSFHPFDASSGWLLTTLQANTAHHSYAIPLLSLLISALAITLALKKAKSGALLADQTLASKVLSRSILRDYQEEKRYTAFFLAPFQYASVFLNYVDSAFVDRLVNLAGQLLVGASRVASWLDQRIVDGLVSLVAQAAQGLGGIIRSVQNGKIQSYYLATFVSLLLLVIWLVASH
jgi:NADH-quinone oxidoreductase subunit L